MITVPSTIFRFSPGAAGSISASTKLFEMLAASLLWRSKAMPAKSWSRAWKKALWVQALCIQTLEPSTEEDFTVWLTQSLAAARARECLLPEIVSDSSTPPEMALGVWNALLEDCWADRLRMLGNGVVPSQAAAAFRFLYAAITRSTP